MIVAIESGVEWYSTLIIYQINYTFIFLVHDVALRVSVQMPRLSSLMDCSLD